MRKHLVFGEVWSSVCAYKREAHLCYSTVTSSTPCPRSSFLSFTRLRPAFRVLKAIMLFRSFVALSLISIAATSPLAFNEDCDCSTVVITTTIGGSSTVMTSVVPPPTSVHSSTGGGGTLPTIDPTLTVTITETLGVPPVPTQAPPISIGSSSDCEGTTKYTIVTAQPTTPLSAPPATPTAGDPSDPATSSPAGGSCGGAPVSCCNSVAPVCLLFFCWMERRPDDTFVA
jgi:hypothetical protein